MTVDKGITIFNCLVSLNIYEVGLYYQTSKYMIIFYLFSCRFYSLKDNCPYFQQILTCIV